MTLRRWLPAAAALLLVGAAPVERVIPLPGVDGEALVVPPNSPVKFQKFGDDDVAVFSGRFVLSGTYSLECDYCEPPSKEEDLVLTVVPDPALAARLPHWKIRNQDIKIYLNESEPLIRAIGTAAARAQVVSGKRDDIHGHIAVVVDGFRLAIECDSSSYWARFVSVVKSPELAAAQPQGNYGCA